MGFLYNGRNQTEMGEKYFRRALQGINAANLEQVMVCHCLTQKDYQCALAWCDSIDVPLTATELRINVYEQMGDWQRTFALRNESTARYS